MSVAKPLKATLFLSVLLLFFASAFAKTEVYFSPKVALDEVFYREFSKAEKTIDLSIYTFSSGEIKKLLIKKAQEGVAIKIIINDGSNDKVKSFVKELHDAGVVVRTTGKINHHKFAIVDSQTFINSSGNISGSPRARSYDENMVVCDSCPDLKNSFQEEFDALLRFSNPVLGDDFNPAPSSLEKKSPINENRENALYTSANFRPYLRSGKIGIKVPREIKNGLGAVEAELVSVIDEARKTIHVATGHFRSLSLYEALVRARQRGLKVQLVLDSQEHISSYKQKQENSKVQKCMEKGKTKGQCYASGVHFSRMADQEGIDVRYKIYGYRFHFPYAKQMHHKYLVIDGRTVYSGSYNWSNNAEFETLENVAIYDDREVAEAFLENFNSILSYGEGFEKKLSGVKNAKRSLPLVFDPITLNTDEVDQLKSAARKKCKNLYQLPVTSTKCNLTR